MKMKSFVLAALIGVAPAFYSHADDLATSGGFVTTEAQLAFSGISLSDIGTTYLLKAQMTGGWVSAKDGPVSFCARSTVEGGVRYQAQYLEGTNVKCVLVELSDGEGGVYIKAVDRAFYNTDSTYYGKDVYNTSRTFAGEVATSSDSGTYGVHNLGLVAASDMESININFHNGTALNTASAVGASDYSVIGSAWSQMPGNNNESLTGIQIKGTSEAGTFFGTLTGANATITGTRGHYGWGDYSSNTDVRYAYIDENNDNLTPTVTVTGVPFEFCRVVFYASTDNDNIKFGYVSVNGEDFTSANSEKGDSQQYPTISGAASWGKSRVFAYLEGVNYLVTPVLPVGRGGTIEVVGHKMSDARGCIAAIQIIKAEQPSEISETAITATMINAVAPSGEVTCLRVPAGATITLDADLAASKVMFVCSGDLSFQTDGDVQPSAEELAKIDLTHVDGFVARSWLTPGVVGFNFNADAGRNGNGTNDAAIDTTLALEIGTWYKNGHDASGYSTEMFADGLSKLTWSAHNVYSEDGAITSGGTFIQGYLDDGNGGVSITLSGVPYETYDVIIYCSTDNSEKGFKAKTVNGTIYTWDASAGETVVTDNSAAVWGLASAAAGKAVYGANTIRVNGLSGALSIKGGVNENNGRGCISAIQIMPAGTSTAPTMNVGTAGQATAATWSDTALWENGVKATSGTAIINVSGDVTLTIDETIDLSAVSVHGTGTLKFVTGSGIAAAMDSLSSPLEIIFADPGLTVSTMSAPATYIYRVTSLASALLGNTYAAGAGSVDGATTNAVAIAHNGGSVALTNSTFYLSESSSAASTDVSMIDATVYYTDGLGVGTASYLIGGTTTITTPKLVLSQGNHYRNATMVVKDSASVTVTGTSDVDSNQSSIMFGHWMGPSSFYLMDNATFTAASQVLVGKTGETQSIYLDGGVFTARGIKVSSSEVGSNYTLSLRGGSLVLEDVGITSYGSPAINVKVYEDTGICAAASALPITQPIEFMTVGKTLAFTKDANVGAATVQLYGEVVGEGTITVASGMTLDLGTSRPADAMISIPADGALVLSLANKSEVPVLNVDALPSIITLYDTDGVTEITDKSITYDSESGTIKIMTRPIWSHTVDYSFDTAGNWSSEAVPVDGQKASLNASEDMTVTVNGAYSLSEFSAGGAGNVVMSGNGSIASGLYDFSATTGRFEFDFSTGSSPVTSGADTVLPAGGSGTVTVAAGSKLTLGPWGDAQDDVYTYSQFSPVAGSTLVFAPGEGKTQKSSSAFGVSSANTTIVISNGTYCVDCAGGAGGHFGSDTLVIEDGGILSLEKVLDATGYNNASQSLTVNEGGILQVRMRDTLRRPLVMNGGTFTVQNAQGNSAAEGRAVDFFNGNTVSVVKDSTIQAIAGGKSYDGNGTEISGEVVDNPLIWLRGGETAFVFSNNAKLVNNVTYASETGGARGMTLSGTGCFVQNGFNGNPMTYSGTTAIGSGITFEMNAAHANAGAYTVGDGAKLKGSGAITGAGGVTLSAGSSKLCGSLTIANLTATSGGIIGEDYSSDSIALNVTDSLTAAGTLNLRNGSFTIGKDCTVTNSSGTAGTTDASFNVAANASLAIAKSIAVNGLTVADGGTITLVAASSRVPASLSVAGTVSYAGKVNFVLDFGAANPLVNTQITLLSAGTLPALENVTVSDKNNLKKWKVTVEDGVLKAMANSAFFFTVR